MFGLSKKQIYRITFAILIISMVLELCGVHLHSPKWWPLPFGYNVFFGFVGGWLLIIVSKMIMAPLLQREENFYEEGSEEE